MVSQQNEKSTQKCVRWYLSHSMLIIDGLGHISILSMLISAIHMYTQVKLWIWYIYINSTLYIVIL